MAKIMIMRRMVGHDNMTLFRLQGLQLKWQHRVADALTRQLERT